MSFFSSLDNIRRSARSSTLSRILAVLLGGTLNQRVIVIMGLAIIAFSLFWLVTHLWQPLLIGAVGGIVLWLALKDYERTSGRSV